MRQFDHGVSRGSGIGRQVERIAGRLLIGGRGRG